MIVLEVVMLVRPLLVEYITWRTQVGLPEPVLSIPIVVDILVVVDAATRPQRNHIVRTLLPIQPRPPTPGAAIRY